MLFRFHRCATGSLVRVILPRFIGDRRRSVVAAAAAVILPQTWISSQQQQQQTAAFSSARSKPPTEDKPFVVKSDIMRARWTPDEDQRLREGVQKFGPLWRKISEALLPHRLPKGCKERWTLTLDPKIKNGIWTPAEDVRLKKLVGEFGEGNWAEIAEHMGGRTRTACRIRWTQRTDPSLVKGEWSAEEDAVLLKEYALHPNKWVSIKEKLPGRSDNSIRDRHKSLTNSRADRIFWGDEEDQLLKAAVDKHTTRDWSKVAEDVLGRTKDQCKNRWIVVMVHNGKTEAAWSPENDALLKMGVEELGTNGKWATIAARIPGKSGKECKSRWERVVSRENNTTPWSEDEDATIKRMREEGKNWNDIFSNLPGRGKDAIKKRCAELGVGIASCGKRWTKVEIAALHAVLLQYEGKKKDWNKIAEQVSGKTPKECKVRLQSEKRNERNRLR